MHVGGVTADLNWLLHLIFSLFLAAITLLYLVKNTASKYFEVDANFDGGGASTANRDNRLAAGGSSMGAEEASGSSSSSSSNSCANCGISGTKKCSRCKAVKYCSSACQEAHWKSGHKLKCKDFRLNATQTAGKNFGLKASAAVVKNFSGIALVPTSGTSNKPIKKPRKVLFPYDEFIKLYKWNKPGFTPCGLLNCGNSCFANVVLQCLTYTRPLVAYLLEKGHLRECRRNDWCFLCEFQMHVERSCQSLHPFSPINILSRLPNIGGNLGYGRQEDAHEFMRFAIDTMQSVCLDEFGGEKAVEPSSQETTLIQHIFGGHLQSQVICTKCNKISNQLENMMDLTVEIHGDAASLEECLDQFTVQEWLHGENMYKCDGCNDYVKAWKRLTIERAPNILTIALKRFQSGRFGKLNKRVTFPERLDLSPYMSEEGDGTDLYQLYAVVVHVDMLNASFFGHYICYTKDFCGNWYRIDDCKVTSVELEEVLSQGAYMLLYSRVSVRPSCLRNLEPLKEEQRQAKGKMELESCTEEVALESENAVSTSGSPASESQSEIVTKHFEDVGTANIDSRSALYDVSASKNKSSAGLETEAVRGKEDRDEFNSELHLSDIEVISSCDKDASVVIGSGTVGEDPEAMNLVDRVLSLPTSMEVSCSEKGLSAAMDLEDIVTEDPVAMEISCYEKDSSVAIDSEDIMVEDSGNADLVNSDSSSAIVKGVEMNGSILSFSSEVKISEN